MPENENFSLPQPPLEAFFQTPEAKENATYNLHMIDGGNCVNDQQFEMTREEFDDLKANLAFERGMFDRENSVGEYVYKSSKLALQALRRADGHCTPYETLIENLVWALGRNQYPHPKEVLGFFEQFKEDFDYLVRDAAKVIVNYPGVAERYARSHACKLAQMPFRGD